MSASEKSQLQPLRVFISYSHDSHEHCDQVLAFAQQLRRDGIDAELDQFHQDELVHWPRWCEEQLRPENSNYVLCVCSAEYRRRVENRVPADIGKGVFWEATLIYNYLYDEKGNKRCMPVLIGGAQEDAIPQILRGWNRYQLTTFRLKNGDPGYEGLYRLLTGKPKVKPEPLGKQLSLLEKGAPGAPEQALPPRLKISERKTDFMRIIEVLQLPERNPFFTGREPVLAQLEEALSGRGRVALSGLGGVGKTQTAVEYAHRHLDEYVYTFWATAHSPEALVSGYLAVAGLLKLPESDAKDQTLAVDAVKRWLGSHEGWLLILDNADDIGMAREFIPPGKNGHVLLTTRARAVGAVARLVEIQEMGTQEGALFLLRRANYVAENAELDSASRADQETATEIAIQLDGLPLALDQAAAYIEETGCGLLGYLSLYRTHGPELLQLRGTMASDHPDPVATTWALSFENIEKVNAAAVELLRFCAFLNPDGISEEVFSEGAPELGPVLGAVATDAFALNSAISEILKYSLLRRDANVGSLEIHRLVQAVLKQAMDKDTQRLWAARAVGAVNRAFPSVEFSTWTVCERLLPQVYACAELIKQWGFGFPEAARLLNAAGFYLHERARYTDAEPFYKLSLVIREKALGAEHPSVSNTLNNLAGLYSDQGQNAKAQPLYERALAIREKALGPEHRSVATSLNNLAGLYTDQGRHAKAEPLYERALAVSEKALGPNHPDVAKSLNNLAGLYSNQGQYAKAGPLYKRALAICEKALGPAHPNVATSLNNLALLHSKQGQYAKAEPLYERALAIYEKALGPEHRSVATSLNNLAGLYEDQGQYAKAERLYERALAIYEKALGPEHPDVATSLNNLAQLLKDTNRLEEAEPLMRRPLVILMMFTRGTGHPHPHLRVAFDNYRSLLEKMSLGEQEIAKRLDQVGIDAGLDLQSFSKLLEKL